MNKILYLYRIFAKLFSFFIFGLEAVVVFATIIPFLWIFSKSKELFQKRARYVIHCAGKSVVKIMCFIQILEIEISDEDKKKLYDAKSSIVIANHPAFYDSFLFISLLPHSDFIVKSALSSKNFLSPLVNTLYMPNTTELELMIERSRKNFDNGGTLMVFPEGTRSLPEGQRKYKKGAARISLATKVPVLPVYLGGNQKVGMRKGDKLFQVHPTEKYRYKISVKDFIYPDEFLDLPFAIGSKKFTEKLESVMSDENNRNLCYN